MPIFEIGKKVIAIEDHPTKAFKKGDIFVVNGISQMSCCKTLVLDIGIKSKTEYTLCVVCNQFTRSDSIWWFYAKRFIPLEEEEFKQVTFTKIIEQVPVGAN